MVVISFDPLQKRDLQMIKGDTKKGHKYLFSQTKDIAPRATLHFKKSKQKVSRLIELLYTFFYFKEYLGGVFIILAYVILLIYCYNYIYKNYVKMAICGPKLSLAGCIISAWGIVQLVSIISDSLIISFPSL